MSFAASAVSASVLVSFLIDVGIQLVFYVASALMHTERLYDLSGALTYQTTTLVALLVRWDPNDSLSALSFRQILAAILVLVWSARLGLFLFERVLRVPDKVY